MPLIDTDKLEAHLGLEAAVAAEVERFAALGEADLRGIKGQLWYDAMLAVPGTPAPAGPGPDAAVPEVAIHAPEAGAEVPNAFWLVGEATDDVAVTALSYRWRVDGGPWSATVMLPCVVPSAVVPFAHRLSRPVGPGCAVELTVFAEQEAPGGGTGTVAFTLVERARWDPEAALHQALPPLAARRLAERAEALLTLRHALVHLNLRIDEGGGILTVEWTDDGSGTKTQRHYAGAGQLTATRETLLRQAKLLVGGDVRVEYEGTASALMSGVEGWSGGGGFLGVI